MPASATAAVAASPVSSRRTTTLVQAQLASHAAAPSAGPLKQQLVPCRTQRSAASRGRVAVAAAADGEVLDTVVVGAGISGLVTAQALLTKHGDQVKSFLVTEGRERVGGNITSLQGDGYVWEEGPNSFQPNDSMLQAAVSGTMGLEAWRGWADGWECMHAEQQLTARGVSSKLGQGGDWVLRGGGVPFSTVCMGAGHGGSPPSSAHPGSCRM